MLRDIVSDLLGPDWSDARLSLIEDRPTDPAPLRALRFRTAEGEDVPALYLPSRTGAAVLYCHAHGNRYDIGTRELVEGRRALHAPYLDAFIARGWGVLSVEMPCFGSRAEPGESARTKARLWRGSTLFGQMLGEQRAARDWLAQTADVDESRIAVMGVSMGGTLAWWLAAMAQDFAAAVSIACFADLATLVESGAHDGHGIYMMVPGLLSVTDSGSLCGLAAPTPMLHCAGMRDWSTPPDAFDRAAHALRVAYDTAGAADHLHFYSDLDAGHEETGVMRKTVLSFLEAALESLPGKPSG